MCIRDRDHATFTIKWRGTKTKYLLLLILDGASNLLSTYPQSTLTSVETIENMRQWMHDHNCIPKSICGDMAFHDDQFVAFYKFKGINPVPTGGYTPWPNRAETAVRLFKRIFYKLAMDCSVEPGFKFPSFRQLTRVACWSRNVAPMSSGKSPLECATGRRPPPLLDAETCSPEQLTMEFNANDKYDLQLQRMALKAHNEVKQQEDILRDIGRRVQPSEGVFTPDDKCYFWVNDPTKMHNGRWVKGKVLAHKNGMVTIETNKEVVKLNQAKVCLLYTSDAADE